MTSNRSAYGWREPYDLRDVARRTLPLAALMVLAAVLRFQGLTEQSFWSDEAVTVLLVDRGAHEMLTGVLNTESSPPLYYVLAWLWTALVGSDEVGLRSLSAVLGVLTVPVAYATGRSLDSTRAGLAASALVATSPLLVWYSQEGRAYALLVLLCGLSFWAFVAAYRTPQSSAVLAAWWLTSSLAVLTHYFASFVILVEALFLLRRHRIRPVLVAVAGVGVTMVAVLPLALYQRGGGQAEYIAESSLLRRVVTLGKQDLVGLDAPYDKVATLLVAAAVFACMTLFMRGQDRPARNRALLAASVGIAAILLPIALAFVGFDYVNTQNMLGAWIAVLVALGVTIAGGAPRLASHALLLGICAIWVALVLGVTRDDRFHRANWRGALESAVKTSPENGRLLVVGPDYEGWFARAPVLVYLPDARSVDPVTRTVARFRALVRPHNRERLSDRQEELVVLLLGITLDPSDTARLLHPRHRFVEAVRGTGFDLLRFRLSPGTSVWRNGSTPTSVSGVPVATVVVP